MSKLKRNTILKNIFWLSILGFTLGYYGLNSPSVQVNTEKGIPKYADFSDYKKKPKNEKAPKIIYSEREKKVSEAKIARYERKQRMEAANPSSTSRRKFNGSSYANGQIKGNWIQQEFVHSTYQDKGFRVINSAYDKAKDRVYVISYAGHLWRINRDENNVTNTSWTILNNKENLGGRSLHVLNLPNGNSRFVRAYDSKMQYSNNEGKNWRDAKGINFQDATNMSAMQDLAAGQRILALVKTNNQIEAVTTEDGINYTSIGKMSPQSKVMSVTNSDNLYIVSVESNAVKTFRLSPNDKNPKLIHTANISVPSSSYLRIFGTRANGRYHFYYIEDSSIYYSNNEGATWTQTRSAPYTGTGDQKPIGVDPKNPTNLFSGFLDLNISTDYGKSFQETGHKLGWDIRHLSNYVKKNGTTFSIVGNDFGVFMSYSPSNIDTYINLNNGAGNPMVYDADASSYGWSNAALQDRGAIEFSQSEKSSVDEIKSTDGLRVVYANGGKSSWAWLYYGALYHKNNSGYKSGPISAPSYFTGNWNGGVLVESPNPNEDAVYVGLWQQLFKYTFNGSEIIQAGHPYEFDSAITGFGYSAVDRNRWYVSTKNGDFYYSTDGGNSFTKSASTIKKPIANDLNWTYTRVQHTIKTSATNPLRVYYVGSGNTMLISNDGGQTFTEHNRGLDVYRFKDIAVTEDDKFVFAACGDGGMWVFSADDNRWYEMFDAPIPNVDVTSVEYVQNQRMVQFSTFGYGIMQLILTSPTVATTNENNNNGAETSVSGDNGLRGTYYNNMDFTNSKINRVDATIDFNWRTGSPDRAINSNTFSVVWEGFVSAPTSGTYTFYTNTDDGVRLTVNNQLIINQFIDQAPTEVTGRIAMTAGTRIPIKMEYFENRGGAVAQLSWSGPSVGKQIIPQTNLFTTNNAVANTDDQVSNPSSTNNNRLEINGSYTVKSRNVNQNVIAPSWDGYNASMYDASIIFEGHKWTFQHIGGKKHTIQNKQSGRYLSVSAQKCENSANVETWTSANADNLQWYIERSGNNYYLLPVHCPTQALSMQDSEANVITWSYNKSYNNQKFDIIPFEEDDRLIIDGEHTIKSTSINQNVIAPSWSNFSARMYDASFIYEDHKWTFQHIGNKKHTIQNKQSGRYLSGSEQKCENGTNVETGTSADADNSEWYIERSGDAYYLLPVHCPTQALSRQNSGANLNTWSYDQNANNQKFDIIPTDGSARPRSDNSSMSDLNASVTLDRKANLEWAYYLPKTINKVISYTFQHYHKETDTYTDLYTLEPDDNEFSNKIQTNFTHDTPEVGENHYQVKIEFITGEFAYSNPTQVALEPIALPINFAPNPVKNELRLNLANYQQRTINYSIISMQGKTLYQGRFDSGHADLETIDLQAYQNGTYFLYLQPENHKGITQKFMVMKDY